MTKNLDVRFFEVAAVEVGVGAGVSTGVLNATALRFLPILGVESGGCFLFDNFDVLAGVLHSTFSGFCFSISVSSSSSLSRFSYGNKKFISGTFVR